MVPSGWRAVVECNRNCLLLGGNHHAPSRRLHRAADRFSLRRN